MSSSVLRSVGAVSTPLPPNAPNNTNTPPITAINSNAINTLSSGDTSVGTNLLTIPTVVIPTGLLLSIANSTMVPQSTTASAPSVSTATSTLVNATPSTTAVVVVKPKRVQRHFQWSNAHIAKANSTPLLNSWDYATPKRPANPDATVISAADLHRRLAALHAADIAEGGDDTPMNIDDSHCDDHHVDTDNDTASPTSDSPIDVRRRRHLHHHDSDAEHTLPSSVSMHTLSISLPACMNGKSSTCDSANNSSSSPEASIKTRRLRSVASARVAALSGPLASSAPVSSSVPTYSRSITTPSSFGSPCTVTNERRQLSNNYISNGNNAAIVASTNNNNTNNIRSYGKVSNITVYGPINNQRANGNTNTNYVTLPPLDRIGSGQYVYNTNTNMNGSPVTTSTTSVVKTSTLQAPSAAPQQRRSTASSILSVLQRLVR